MPKVSIRNKQKRLDQLLGLLRSRSSWTTAGLKKSLGVSQRTLLRDLADLSENGVPIESERGRGGGLRLAKNWGIGKVSFTTSEITDLLLALTVMEKMRSPLMMKELKSVKNKLYQTFPSEQRQSFQKVVGRIMVRDKASAELASTFKGINSDVAQNVQKSFGENKILTITYVSESKSKSIRKVEPYYLILIWPRWYIQAWDHKTETIRFFRLDRILSCNIEKEVFSLDRDFEFRAIAEKYFESI